MTDKRRPPPSNTVRVWMPLYIGDYLSDTMGLSHAQHGAYFLSIIAYWRKGEALTDTELRTITGKEFSRISEFYISMDNRWHHKRIDIELEKALQMNARMKSISEKGVEKRRALGQLPKEPYG